MNNAGREDEEKLDSVLSGVRSINNAITKDRMNAFMQGGTHIVDKFIAPLPDSEISILNPILSRNKGCGSGIKSSGDS